MSFDINKFKSALTSEQCDEFGSIWDEYNELLFAGDNKMKAEWLLFNQEIETISGMNRPDSQTFQTIYNKYFINESSGFKKLKTSLNDIKVRIQDLDNKLKNHYDCIKNHQKDGVIFFGLLMLCKNYLLGNLLKELPIEQMSFEMEQLNLF